MCIAASLYVWEHSKQTGTSLIMMLALADMADEETFQCFPGVPKLASRCRLTTTRQAQIILRQLEAEGEIVIAEGKGVKTSHGWTNRYQIVAPGKAPMQPYKKPRKPKPTQEENTPTPLPDEGANPNAPLDEGVNPDSPQDLNPPSPQDMNHNSENPKGDPKGELNTLTSDDVVASISEGEEKAPVEEIQTPAVDLNPPAEEPAASDPHTPIQEPVKVLKLEETHFSLVAKLSFGIPDISVLRKGESDTKKQKREKKDAGFLISQISYWLEKLTPVVTFEEIKRFYTWYDGKTRNGNGTSAARPRDLAKFQLHFLEFRPLFATKNAQEQAAAAKKQKPTEPESEPEAPKLNFVKINLPNYDGLGHTAESWSKAL